MANETKTLCALAYGSGKPEWLIMAAVSIHRTITHNGI